MADDKKVTVVLVDDDKDFADTRQGSILDHFPDVQFIHYSTGIGLVTALQSGLQPDVVIMDYDLSKADDWQDGTHYTRKLKDDYPDMVIIGCCGPDNDGSITRRQEAFLKAGADAFVNTHDGVEALLAELEKWLTEEDGVFDNRVALVTIAGMAALVIIGLFTAPGLMISGFTLPAGLIFAAVSGWLTFFGPLRKDIGVPLLGVSLGVALVGFLYVLLATWH